MWPDSVLSRRQKLITPVEEQQAKLCSSVTKRSTRQAYDLNKATLVHLTLPRTVPQRQSCLVATD